VIDETGMDHRDIFALHVHDFLKVMSGVL